MLDPRNDLSAGLAGRYRIERELGQGGMATVYLAQDLKHHRRVAIKVLRPELAAAVGAERFLAEIQTTANLHHPHILPLFDSGEVDGQVFYAMPYVDGESLRERLEREHQLPIDDAVRIARGVASALGHAHRHGVIHRDIKPGNILLQDGEPIVADFGIARAASHASEQRLTETGLSLGTPHYMSPEQATGSHDVDARTDIYALAAVLFEMLAGEPPHTGPTIQAVLAKVATQKPRALSEYRPRVSAHVEAAVAKGLEKISADRFATAEAFGNALSDSTFRDTGDESPIRQRSSSRRKQLTIAAVLVALALWGGVEIVKRAGAAPAVDAGLYAVFPFRVSTTDPSVANMREGMVELLHVKLSSIRSSIEPNTLLDRWRRAGGGETDPPLEASLEVAEALGAGRAVIGGMVASPQRIDLSASLYESTSGDVLATASVSGSIDQLTSLIDDLTAQILSLEAGQSSDRLESLTTTSFQALGNYLDGMSLYRRGLYREALESFSLAVREDSTFALAAVYMAQADGMVPSVVPGVESGLAARIVRTNRERLVPRDQLLSLAFFPDPSDTRLGIERWEALIPQLGDRADVWFQLGDALFHSGPARGRERSLQDAKQAFSKAVELDSSFFEPLHHLVWIAAIEGDTAFVRRITTRYLESQTAGRVAEEFTLRLTLLNQDTAAVRRLDANLASLSDEFLLGMISAAPRFAANEALWDPERAQRALAIQLERSGTPTERLNTLGRQYWLMLNLGRPQAANRAREEIVAIAPEQRGLRDQVSIVAAIYMDGDRETADAAVERLRQLPSLTSAQSHLVAYWDLERGRTEGVRNVIERLTTSGAPLADSIRSGILALKLGEIEGDSTLLSRALDLDAKLRRAVGLPQFVGQGNLTVAHVFAALGDYRRALAAAQRYERGSSLERDRFGPTFLREQGRYAASLGLRDDAIRAYETYLSVRANPEPSLQPQVDSVKAALAALRAVTDP